MNRLLADTLSQVNAFVALVIVLAGAGIGAAIADNLDDNVTFGFGIGLLCGVIVAGLFCGLLATLSLIERHLRLIADDIEEMRSREPTDRP